MGSSAVPGIFPDLSTILSQSGAEFGEIFSQPDLASMWMLNNPAAMLPGNPFPGGFPQVASNFGGMDGAKRKKGDEFSGFGPLHFGGTNQVNWLEFKQNYKFFSRIEIVFFILMLEKFIKTKNKKLFLIV